MAKVTRKDAWKPERLDSNESPKGRDISSRIESQQRRDAKR
jgi:hypothetical protein